jgi:hypothetical protein
MLNLLDDIEHNVVLVKLQQLKLPTGPFGFLRWSSSSSNISFELVCLISLVRFFFKIALRENYFYE